ncbi:D site-binding protein-like [Manacus candei]|uniref:D site-binding protein-like n=1 Tax=Manacus candei TaxID=415023 RepID=UPI0022271185|nr:D site-binding protein-like [Manacus candei]
MAPAASPRPRWRRSPARAAGRDKMAAACPQPRWRPGDARTEHGGRSFGTTSKMAGGRCSGQSENPARPPPLPPRGSGPGCPPRPPRPPPGDLEYVDLDEFLREHGLPPSPPEPPGHERPPAPGPPRGPPSPPPPGEPLLEAELGGPGGGPGGGPFDPRRLRFSQDELRPQPIARKARKVHVPEEQKDEKYWSRRSRNNAAAKRSRDARRLKENQISVRAAFLERENAALRLEVAAARRELQRFRAILARYEARHGQL